MKKILIAVGAIVALVVVAILALPALVPADRIKDELVAQVKQATGRDLTIGGDVSVSVLPSLAVEVSDVALSSPTGFTARDMVRLGALDLKLKLFPMLSGRVEIDSFVLVKPVIMLEVDTKGRANWTFDTPAKPAASPSSTASEPSSGGSMSSLGDLSLGQVAIRDGLLIFTDAQAGTSQTFSDINLAVTLDSLDSPLAVKGALVWRNQLTELNFDLADPRAVMDGKASAAGLSLSAQPVRLTYKGDIQGGAKPGLGGEMDVSIPSVRNLVAWTTGKPLEMAGDGMGPFALNGKLAAGPTRVALTGARLSLDAIKADGDFTVDIAGARPSLKGRLAVETLDVNPYLPPDEAKAAGKPSPSTPSSNAAAAPADWSDEPLDASGLKAADVDFALSVGTIRVKDIEIGRSALKLTLVNGRMVADLSEMALYQGSGKGRFAVDGSAPGLGIDAQFALNNLQAAPFLTAAAGFDRIEGTANTQFKIAGRGRTERQLVSSLDGAGSVTFLDGALRGFNLAAMVRNVTTAFSDTSGPQKTDFAELSGTWTMDGGMVTNRDLKLMSPLLRVDGAGTVDLPKRALKYRIEPKAVASIEGQGGSTDVSGIMVPVIAEGPWHALTYRPDVESMVKQGIGDALNRALGGGKTAPAGDTTAPLKLPIDPGKLLFGR